MKKTVLAFAAFATTVTMVAAPALASSNDLRVKVQWSDGDNRPPRPRYDAPRGYDERDRRPNWGERRPAILSPRQITRTLERRGFAVGDIRLDRGTYFVRATRPNGRRAIVVVDAFNGRILDVRPARPRAY